MKKSPLTGKTASVHLERNGLSIRIDDVPAAEAACVAFDLLEAMRLMTRFAPELVPDLNPVGGYSPLDTSADDWQQDDRRAGFRVRR